MHRTASQGTGWEIPAACPSTGSADGDFSDFLEEESFSLPITDGGVEQEEKNNFQSLKREQFDQPAPKSEGQLNRGNSSWEYSDSWPG